MTRARTLKHAIRARAARTGERYTTARRHVLKTPAPPAAAVERAPARPSNPKGSLSDAKCLEKTGHALDHWFAVLDRFGGVEKGHTASARHLHDTHNVDGWYAQGITVAYERARGVRAVNQRVSGEYEVSVSKVITATTAGIVDALTKPRMRKRWLAGVDADLARALTAALDSPQSKGVVVRPDGQGRYRYKWGSTTVQMYLLPKVGGKVSVVVTNSKLERAAMVEERRAMWRAALEALAGLFAESKTRRR